MQVVAPPAASCGCARAAAPRLHRAPRGAALRPRAVFTSEGSNVTLDSYIVVVRAASRLIGRGRALKRRLAPASPQGKAHCFEKVDQRLVERFVIEPITPASLESMVAGAAAAATPTLAPLSS